MTNLFHLFKGQRSNKSLNARLRKSRAALRFQLLERRQLLAVADVVHEYRNEDFSISGSFSYLLTTLDGYRDAITAGEYASQTGHIEWTSPSSGTGFFVGTATGDGNDSFLAGGARRACSAYGIEDRGQLGFTIDAQQETLRVDENELQSVRYTHYTDLTRGSCPEPSPPWSRFFGGMSNFYAGSFDPKVSEATINYESNDGFTQLSISTEPATVIWQDNGLNDVVLQVSSPEEELEIPGDWIFVEQTTEPAEMDYIDLLVGVDIKGEIFGKPLVPSADVNELAAPIKLYWTQAANDVNREEITVTTSGDPLGLYWNSKTVSAQVRDFPEKPTWANYVKIELPLIPGELNFENNSVYLRIEDFEAGNSSIAEITEDTVINGVAGSILSLTDSTDPDVAVLAYAPKSFLGAKVEVFNDDGSFYYDPTQSEFIQALAPGEQVIDAMEFAAIKYQKLKSFASYVVPLIGVNDLPIAIEDFASTTNDQSLNLTPLANDYDIDNGDQVRVKSVDATSEQGAKVVLNEDGSVDYDPVSSESLQALELDEQVIDSFNYQIIDLHGGVRTGRVEIEVTGVEKIQKPRINIIVRNFTRQNTSTEPIPFTIEQPNADLSQLQVTISSNAPELLPPENLSISGSDGNRSLVAMPVANQTGRAWITLTATDPQGNSGETTFEIVVGTAVDLDLDGVSDAMEDAAPNTGDFNHDGVADSQQPYVASIASLDASHYVSLTTHPSSYLLSTSLTDAPIADGIAAGAQFPMGLVHFELIHRDSSSTPNVSLRSSQTETPINAAFFQTTQGENPGWRRYMRNRVEGAKIFSDHVEVDLVDGGRTDDDQSANGTIQAAIGLASVERPWTNTNAFDVNNDSLVQPIDALIVINDLNRKGIRELHSTLSQDEQLPNFIDVSGDEKAAPIDALLIINFLNRQPGAPEGEGQGGGLVAYPEAGYSLQPSSSAWNWNADTDNSKRLRRMHDEAIRQW